MSEEKRPESTLTFNLFFLGAHGHADVNAKRARFSEIVAFWVLQYPWYNERFHLSLSNVLDLPTPCLCGQLNFGDCIEDEWFAVWILLQLTKDDYNVAIQVTDEDGEFLLIEAAEVLPKWLNPENSANRVWLYRGQVVIIPIKKPDSLTLSDAMTALQDVFTNRSSEPSFVAAVQEAIKLRISRFPQSAGHCAHLLLPYPVAAILTLPASDSLIGAAILALANSDSRTRPSSRSRKSKCILFSRGYQHNADIIATTTQWPTLLALSDQFVLRPCMFNRVHYSRLRSIPTPTGMKYPRQCSSAAERLATELGIKLSTGLDLILSSSPPGDWSSLESGVADSDPSWLNFWNSLQSRLTASGGVEKLKADAKLYYRDNISEICSHRADDYYNWSAKHPGAALHQMLDAVERSSVTVPSVDQFMAQEPTLPPADDDSWMFITPEELDAELTSHYSAGAAWCQKSGSSQDVESIASKLNNFISASSSFKGVDVSKVGAKRPSHSTPLGDSVSDTDDGDSSDDSETGYSEAKELVPKVATPKFSNLPIPMGNLMDRLMCQVAGSSVRNSWENGAPKRWSTNNSHRSDRPSSTLACVTSSSDEDLNMYSAGSDLRADYDRAVSAIYSGNSADEYPAKVKPHISKRVSSAQPPASTTLHQVASSTWTAMKSALGELEDSTSDEEPTAGEARWWSTRASKSLRDAKTDDMHSSPDALASSSSGDDGGTFDEYVSQLEKELFDQPVNVGRCVTSKSPTGYHSVLARNRDGISDRKKARRVPMNVPLAMPENADSLDQSDQRADCDMEANRVSSAQPPASTTLHQVASSTWTLMKSTLSELEDSPSDEEPTAGEIRWWSTRTSKSLRDAKTDYMHSSPDALASSSSGDDGGTFDEYVSQLEKELFDQPVNLGRCVTSKFPTGYHSVLARNRDGISDRKVNVLSS
ncbi:unnamed protein product [Dicrocoelium dendriticum]|nr:unnamed protein product [Dicrocoelium dendriticum]